MESPPAECLRFLLSGHESVQILQKHCATRDSLWKERERKGKMTYVRKKHSEPVLKPEHLPPYSFQPFAYLKCEVSQACSNRLAALEKQNV